jgi:hypothetical protein
MPRPHLTFFCELDPQPLEELIDDQLLLDLVKMQASISLGIVDLSPERASIVKRLNRSGIPVIAWLLLPKNQGYWFNLDNYPQAFERYQGFNSWSAENGLKWARIGLDIEPDINELAALMERKWGVLTKVAQRIFNRRRLSLGKQAYVDLVARMHADGFLVDSYQFPLIVDERKAGSTLLQRAAGLVDLPVDREVWMLYSSFAKPLGAGMVASYSPEAQSVGLGSTGGGIDTGSGELPPISWEELARDLRLAWHWCDDLHIFSLEGCVQQGFMARLAAFEWDCPILLPEQSLVKVKAWRSALQGTLWLYARLVPLSIATGLTILTAMIIGRTLKKRRMIEAE